MKKSKKRACFKRYTINWSTNIYCVLETIAQRFEWRVSLLELPEEWATDWGCKERKRTVP